MKSNRFATKKFIMSLSNLEFNLFILITKNLNNILIRIKTIILHQQNVSIIYHPQNLDGDYQLDDMNKFFKMQHLRMLSQSKRGQYY